MRGIWIVAAFLLATATATQGQVAAPRLNPVIPESGGIINPATLIFGGPSRIGLGLASDRTFEETNNGKTTTVAEGDGKFLGQGRFVGDFFAIGVEIGRVELTLPGTDFTGEINGSMVNATLQFGEILAIGIGQQNTELIRKGTFIDFPIPPFLAPFEIVEERSLPMVGASLRLADSFFIGVASGSETFNISVFVDISPVPPLIIIGSEEVQRDVTRFGVGYFSRDLENGLHVEVYQEEREAVDLINPDVNLLLPILAGEETIGATLEVVFTNILIGLEKISTKFTNLTGAVIKEKKEQGISLGYAPANGFSIVLTRTDTENTFAGTENTENSEITFLGIGWLF